VLTIEVLDGPEEWHRLIKLWREAGCSEKESRLLAARHAAVTISLSGSVSDDFTRQALREGLTVWPSNGSTHLAGSVTALQALLMRWPGDTDLRLARELAAAFDVSWSLDACPIDFSSPLLMGILNTTPDSFSDGGRYSTVEKAVRRALDMVEQGAQIVDVGGESTRPGSSAVSVEEELRRVIPAIRAIRERSDVLISVDTQKPQVAEEALAAGANWINDISGLRDPDMLALAARTKAPVVVMHMQGTPRTMQQDPSYKEVVAEVLSWLDDTCRRAQRAGLSPQQLIIDPGIGFGKTTEHNLELLKRLRDFRTLGYPVLVGTSRKSVIGNVLNLPLDQRLEGTAASVSIAVWEGADVIRVHDVQAMRRVIDMTQAMKTGAIGGSST
jgi:dihydropteroate synthase